MRFSAFTLVFASLLVLLPSASAAAPGDTIYLNSRDVLPAHRMIRRRALGSASMPAVMINRRVTDQNDSDGLLGALFGNGDGGKKNSDTNTTSPDTGDTTSNSTTTTNDPTTGGTTNTTDTGNTDPQNPANPDNGAASPSASNTAASTPASATQTAASLSTTASASNSASPTASLNPSVLPSLTDDQFTDLSATASSATSTATDIANNDVSPAVENKSAFSHTTIVILIVAASCIVAGAIIWTAIRKWKFSPSRQFEDRLQRIDWQPATEHEHVLTAGLGGGFRHGTSTRDMSERRTSHGSFGSSDRNHAADNNNDGGSINNVAPDLPPHDFTAGPAGAGYATLARGPSLNRGASLNRGNTNMTRGPSYGRAHYGGYGTQQPANYGYGY